MGQIVCRNIDDVALAKITALAEEANISREEYIRRRLNVFAAADEVFAVEDRYIGLVNSIMELLQANTELLERVSYQLDALGEQDAE